MKCPICEETMDSTVCVCGYDVSRDYEKYPTLGKLSAPVESAASLRQKRQALVRCAGCGWHGFTLSSTDGKLACMRCGRALTEEELKPLMDALGMKEEPEQKKRVIDAVLDRDNVEQVLKSAGEITEEELAEAIEFLGEAVPEAQDPKRIVAIAAGAFHTAALYADGTVRAVGRNTDGACNTDKWENIKAIAAGWRYTIGLKTDGTVTFAGLYTFGLSDVRAWKDITAISAGTFHVLGLKKDGTVVAVGDKSKGKCKTEGWNGITAIAAGGDHSVGLTKKGTVLFAGKGKGTKLPYGAAQGIVGIAACESHTAMLNKENMALIAGDGGKIVELGANNVDIDAGYGFTVVMKKNGTAAASGTNYDGRCNVGDWKELTAIAAGWHHTVGLKKDGTLIATGDNKNGQCDVQKLMR